MRIDRIAITAALCMFFLLSAGARTALAQLPLPVPVNYYVAPGGNDSNTGLLPVKPFKTIQKAVNTITVAGSKIYVAPGTYNETVTFASTVKSGTAAAPMRLIGDVKGTSTGTTAGAVIIHGQGTRSYGLLLNGGSNWKFENLTIQGQTYANVFQNTSGLAGLNFDSCTIGVSPSWGMYFANNGDLTLNNNTFVRTPSSGHVTYIYQTTGTRLIITNNRLNMTGKDYLSSGYKNGTFYGSNGYSTFAYGIIAMAYGTGSNFAMTVQNNVVSDAYLGVYAYCYNVGSGSTMNISNNTSVGCYYAMYVYSDANPTATITNNIAGDSYVSTYISCSKGTLDSHLAYSYSYDPCGNRNWNTCSWISVPKKANLIINQIPSFADARNGDLSLTGTVGIDQGTTTGAPLTDIAGTRRPIDGDGDGKALMDIGAFESALQKARTLKVIQWKESGIAD